ncbi:MAG: ABC transporter substrate-binding protein [Chloroflexi bacterium]|nr:ABC transporter substrate-binding protein [Chloroflexota bacterium]
MHTRTHRLAVFAGTTLLAASLAAPTLAQDASGAAAPTLDPADTGYTVRIGFPSGNRQATANSPADIWAQHLGLFDQVFGAAGITLQYEPFLGAGPAINEALIGGSLDIAAYADTAGVLGKTAGAETTLVAIDDDGTGAWLVVREASDVQSVADLRGRSVATIKATFPHRFLLTVLEANGLTEDDIVFQNLSLPDSEVALEAEQIDAAVTLGQGAPRLLDRGYRVIADVSEVPEAAGIGVFAATDAFLEAHPSFFPVYLATRDQAIAWANANVDEAYQILAESLQLTPEQVQLLYPDFDFPSQLTPEILARIQATDQFLVDQGLAPQAIDVVAWAGEHAEAPAAP